MDRAKRVKYAGDTSCLELLDGFNGKYATDGEIVVNVESMDVCRPRIVNGKPYYRLVKPDGKNYPTLDHIVRLSEGGSHTFDNAQVLCGYCNCIIKG